MRQRSMPREDVARTFPAEAGSLHEVRQFLRERARQAGVTGETLSDLLIAASEACTNVIRHAGVPDMKLRWKFNGGRVEVDVEDAGVYVDPAAGPPRAGGFGVTLMRTLMDDVTIVRGHPGNPGTRVVLSKRLAATTRPTARRSGLRTGRLHGGAVVRQDGEGRQRRRPAWTVLGLGTAAVLVAGGIAFGAVAIAHRGHPNTSLTSNTSTVGRSGRHSTPAPHRGSSGPTTRHGTHTKTGHRGTTTGPASSVAPSPRASTAPSPAGLPTLACPTRALLGVYAPNRLAVLQTCTWVVGRVTSVSLQNDGDQLVTVTAPDGVRRVIEIILGQRLPLPGVGERVAVFGTMVRDRQAGWLGLQPVWAIDYLDRGAVIRTLPPTPPLFHPGEVCVPSDPPVCTQVATPGVNIPTPSLSPVP
jgi:serine/threonine-protein kinase RsbW